jgi:peptidyl-prolyl cis-trans isomerase SurA
MKRISLLIVATFFIFNLNAQNETILTIDGENVSKLDFEYVFKKNNTNTAITTEELDEYMELFINYKLKVREAEDLGMDTMPTFVKELQGYRAQLAAPYLTDSKVDEALIVEAYDRLKQEVRASHILIKVSPDAAPQDTLAAYQQIEEIRNELIATNGDFDAVAANKSQDPSAKKNKGDLGYFTAFQMVYPFENAAFNTPVNEISGVVKTRFGYHILKVTDKRPSRGELKVAHIVIVDNDNMTKAQQAKAKIKIDEIYAKVENGADFSLLAKQFSDDKGSASSGGVLPVFGPGKMVPEFEDQAYKLEKPGDICEPFKSRFGWHVIKLIDVIPLPSFEELEPTIKMKVERDSRSTLSKKAFVQQRMKEIGIKEYEKNLNPFYTWVDSSVFYGKWTVDPSWKMSKPLFTLAKTKYTQTDFANYLLNQMRKSKKRNMQTMPVITFVNNMYGQFRETMVIQYTDDHLEEDYPDFRALMQEYHDGILLFELSDQKVWRKATTDSIGIDTYYQEHKFENMWPERAEGLVYKSLDEKICKQVKQWVSDSLSIDTIMQRVNINSQLNLVIDKGPFTKEGNEVFTKIQWQRGLSEIVLINNQFVFANITDILLPSPKSLDEARGYYISNYQDQLESEWIASLRAKYPVEVNKEVLYSIATN